VSDVEPPVALLLTDLVDSAALAAQHGDAAMAPVWAAHDRMARDLLRQWRGQEIDKTDGFLLLFTRAADALGYVLAYHRALAALPVPMKARAGLHVGQVTVRATPAADVALGAKPFEVDGVSKPIAARVMSTALGGQTLLTPPSVEALKAEAALPERCVSHGHWHVKGLPAPLELFELGDEDAPFTPPPDSAKVFRVVRQGDLWLPLRELRHSLPAERDAFVGRRAMLLELAARYDRGARLVSLLGIGGGGKTRLATRFGWGWMGEFPGGVWFCDLAPARTLEGLYSAVAQGLQLPLGQEDPVVQLGHAIAGRGPCLVILDNFEQLARHAEATLGRWLDRAAQACFLVTTREVLGIAGEETLALAPLPAPEAQNLFTRRAAAAKRDFKPGPEDEEAIATLVRLLDGLPLAIELAAARVRTLAPRALLARMSERFKLLASSGGRQDRQATLRAAFDWSWDLLPTPEKMALAQLSVFEGGFTLEAAEAVIDLQALADPPWTLDVVNALVDKSFVRPLGAERFDLLVSVQAYADEHLRTPGRYSGSGPEALARAHGRHCAWFAALGPQRAVENACAEIDNLVAACRRAVLAGDCTQAAGALDGAWAAINLHGPFNAGVELAQAVCAMPALADAAAAHAQATLGAALEAAGQRSAAREPYERARRCAQAVGDLACESFVCVRLGSLLARGGQADAARASHTHALTLARQAGQAALECAALNGLGVVEFELGRIEPALAHYEAALALARRAGDARWQGSVLGNLGNLHANQGRMAQALPCIEESLLFARRLGDRQREGNTLSNLGMLRYLQGELDEAGLSLEAGLAVARELGYVRLECIVLGNLGLVLAAAGRLEEAVARYEAALAVARQIGDPRTEGQFLGSLGLTQARLGQAVPARENLDRALALLRPLADPLSLGLALSQAAEAAALGGEHEAALAALDEAHACAGSCGAGPGSELGLAIERLRVLLQAG
jgi:predicted ATPase